MPRDRVRAGEAVEAVGAARVAAAAAGTVLGPPAAGAATSEGGTSALKRFDCRT